MTDPSAGLRELFEAALALPPAARAAYLAAHCDDPARRAAVERLLNADAQDCVLERPLDELLARIGETAPTPYPPGARIGAFTLGDALGEGGSAIVFRAEREQAGVRQTVALKLLRRGLYTAEAQRRFLDERRALAQLRHPGIARLIEGGITDAGVPYIALELVDGQPITLHARARGLDLRQRLRCFVDVCRAVEAAHRALIVHRDLKPSNVLVTPEGEVKLLDFGIAKLLDADADGTETRHPAMTPAYAAPEQFGGGPITTATDVYALGVLLGELVTGQRRVAGDSRTPSSQISERSAPGVLPAPPKIARRQIRGDLDNIVLKATASEPERRYASAGALADDVRRHLAGEPVAAHPPSRWYRARKFVARHRGGVSAATLFVLAVVTSLGIALWQADLARQQARLLHAQAQRAEAVRRFLVGVFQNASPEENGGRSLTAQHLLEAGERQVEASLRDQPVLQADVLALLGQLHIEIGDFERADRLLERALAISGGARFPADVRVRVLLGKAWSENETEAYDAAIEHAEAALALLGEAGEDPPSAANAHQITTHALIGKGQPVAAEAQLRAALAQDRRALGDRNEFVCDEWLQLGQVLGDSGRYDESEPAFRTALAGLRAVYGERSNHVAHALNEFSNMLVDKGDLASAEGALREALAIRTETVGADHHDTLTVRNNLLGVVELQGRYAEALPQRLQLIEAAGATGALHPLDLAATYNAIGRDYRELSRLDESEAALRKALAVTAQSQGAGSARSHHSLRHLGLTLVLQGRYAEAESSFRAAIGLQQGHAATSPTLALDRADLGNVLRLQHRWAAALHELQAAAAAYAPAPEHNNPWRPVLLAELSEAQLDTGDPAAALESANRALAYARKAFPAGHPQLGIPLFALARAELARKQPERAEAALREALAARGRLYRKDDVRVLEVEAALVEALSALGRAEEAARLRAEIAPLLRVSSVPYAADLRARLARSSSRH